MSAEGQLSGAARAGVPLGESRLTVEALDSVGNRASAELKVKVVEVGSLTVKTLAIPDSLLGSDYLTDLTAHNADGSPLAKPLTWTLASGSLPDGLTLTTLSEERGIVSGKPLVAGTFTFTLQVEDSKGRADSADFILRVFSARFKLAAVNPPAALHPGDEVSFAIGAGTANATTRFNLSSGRLPPGITLSEQGTVAGTVASENAVGVYNFVVEAQDGSGSTGLGAFSLEVVENPRQAGCSSGVGLFALAALFAPLTFLRRRRTAMAAGLLALAAAALLPLEARAQAVVKYETSRLGCSSNGSHAAPTASVMRATKSRVGATKRRPASWFHRTDLRLAGKSPVRQTSQWRSDTTGCRSSSGNSWPVSGPMASSASADETRSSSMSAGQSCRRSSTPGNRSTKRPNTAGTTVEAIN